MTIYLNKVHTIHVHVEYLMGIHVPWSAEQYSKLRVPVHSAMHASPGLQIRSPRIAGKLTFIFITF